MRRIALVIMAGGVALVTACGGSAPGSHGGSPAPGSRSGSPSPASTGTASATPQGAAATAPPPGTTLASVQGTGRVNVISNLQGQGFTVVDSVMDSDDQDGSYLQAYDAAGGELAKILPGSVTGECGAADVINSKGRLLIAEQVIHHDAQGIQPASDTLTLSAYSAVSGARLWTATLDRDDQNGISCSAYDGNLGSQSSSDTTFTSTADGRWGIWQPDDSYDLSGSAAIDLTTGQVYRRPGLYGALGDYAVVAKMSQYHSPLRLTLMTPGTWAQHGTLTLGGSGMLEEIPGPYNPTLVTSGAQFPTDDVDDPTSAAITPDGTTLVGLRGNFAQGDPTTTVAYSLPAMKELWSIPTPRYYTDSVAGISDSVVVLARQENNGDGSTRLMALNPQTGARIWQRVISSDLSVCALTSTQLVLLVNDQLAFLNPGTGAQTSYQSDPAQDDSGDSACPSMLAGGVSGVSVSDDNTVTQLASP